MSRPTKKSKYTIGKHINDKDKLHSFSYGLALDLGNNIVAACIFNHIQMNIRRQMEKSEHKKGTVEWFKSSYTGMAKYMACTARQVENGVHTLVEAGLIKKRVSNRKNAYALTDTGIKYAKFTNEEKFYNQLVAFDAGKEPNVSTIKEESIDTRVKDVIDYLNTKLCNNKDKRFGYGKTNSRLILDLIDKGYTTSDLKDVINYKYSEWYFDDERRKNIRPSTLFSNKEDRFPCYYEEAQVGLTLQTSELDLKNDSVRRKMEEMLSHNESYYKSKAEEFARLKEFVTNQNRE